MADKILGEIVLGNTSTSSPSIQKRNKTVRLSDLSKGHPPFPPRQNIQASTNVFINRRGAHRRKDLWVLHCSGGSCHDGRLTTGCPTVFVNGKPIGRIGDTISCGDTANTGSNNVFVGEGKNKMATWGSIGTTWKKEPSNWDSI